MFSAAGGSGLVGGEFRETQTFSRIRHQTTHLRELTIACLGAVNAARFVRSLRKRIAAAAYFSHVELKVDRGWSNGISPALTAKYVAF
jgi:hypothetical protein